VLCLPILAGGEEIMWIVACDLARRGYVAAWANRVASLMRPEQSIAAFEGLMRRSVVHNRMVLRWAEREAGVDAHRIAVLGISLGGMLGCALLSVEPEVDAAVICIAGGGLPGLMLESGEARAVRWRHRRRTEQGLPDAEIARRMDRWVVSDPALLGGYVPQEKVLLVATTLDGVVPWENQQLLWESLGRPARLELPLGHYTAAIALPRVLGVAAAFFDARFRASAGREHRAASRVGREPGPHGPRGPGSLRRAAGAGLMLHPLAGNRISWPFPPSPSDLPSSSR